jgi:hypothetical protein
MGAWWLFFFSGDRNYVELFEKIRMLIYVAEMVEKARSLHVGGRVMILIFCHGHRCTNMTSWTIAVLIVLDKKGCFTSRQLICFY